MNLKAIINLDKVRLLVSCSETYYYKSQRKLILQPMEPSLLMPELLCELRNEGFIMRCFMILKNIKKARTNEQGLFFGSMFILQFF